MNPGSRPAYLRRRGYAVNQIWASIGLVLLFVLVGGVFAAAEIALVSLRESQVRAIGQRGARGARVAALAADPNRFLSAVQVGVTLAGFLSAAWGAATLSTKLEDVLRGLGALRSRGRCPSS